MVVPGLVNLGELDAPETVSTGSTVVGAGVSMKLIVDVITITEPLTVLLNVKAVVVYCDAAGTVASATGQTVVDTATVSVTTEPFAGQLVTPGEQDVTV